MSSEDEHRLLPPPQPRRRPKLRLLPLRRSLSKGKKIPTVQLGKRRRGLLRRGGKLFLNLLRKIRFRALVAKYRMVLKKLSSASAELLKDMVEGSAAMEAEQARVFMQAYFAVPMLSMRFMTSSSSEVYV